MSGRGRPPKLVGLEESVIAMYLGGATIGDLKEHFGCSDSPIIRILDDAGIERRRGRPPGRGGTARSPVPPPASSASTKSWTLDELYPPVGRPPVKVLHAEPEPEPEALPPQVRVPSVGPRASRQVTDEVFRRDGYRCRLCGSTTRLTVEYAIPPERGGNSRNPGDLRTVCAPCATSPVKERELSGSKKGLLRRILGR